VEPFNKDGTTNSTLSIKTKYEDVVRNKFEQLNWRAMSREGRLVLTPEEEASQAQQRAERLTAQLRALGVEPEV
jgi:hypothetical protein